MFKALSLIVLFTFIVGCTQDEAEVETPEAIKTHKHGSSNSPHKQNKATTDSTNTATNPFLNSALLTDHLAPFSGDLDQMKERRVIRALVTYSKTDFFIHDGQIKGLQAELLQAYEKELNRSISKQVDKISIAYIPVTFDQLIPALNAGLGDISAALLTQTTKRKKLVDFTGNDGTTLSEVIVRHIKAPKITSLNDLAGKSIYVLKNSSYAEHLHSINATLTADKPINIIEADSRLLSEDILEIVNAGIFEYTVVDDYKAALWAKVLPHIKVETKVPLAINNRVGWAVRKNSPLLLADLNEFSAKRVKKGSLLGNILIKRYL